MLIVVFDEKNKPVDVVDNYTTIKHSTNFKGPGDWSSVVEACDAIRALALKGHPNLMVICGADRSPKSINVVRLPQVGDRVHCTRSGLDEDAGAITRISTTLQTITTSLAGQFTRRTEHSNVWKSQTGWTLKVTN